MDMAVKQLLKIHVQRDALHKALSLVTRFVDKRSTIPILACVLIRADGDVTLTSSNLEQTINVPLPASTAAVGTVCVPAHQLFQLIKGLPKGATVELSHEGELQQHLVVRSGALQFQLPVRAPEDFPSELLDKVQSSFAISAALLRDMIAKTKIAMSTESTRFYLNGLCINVQQTDGLAYAIATDGSRLAEFSFPLPAGAADFRLDNAGIIIPRLAVLELEKALARETADVTVKLYTGKATRLTFTTPQWDMVTMIVDGAFPDWKRVMPDAKLLPTLRFDSKAAQALIANVRAVQDDSTRHSRGRAVRLTLGATDTLRIDATGYDAESKPVNAAGTIAAQWGAGTELEIGFNGQFLADQLALIPGDAVIKISDAGSPVTILDPRDTRAVFVLMPMRV